MTEKFIRNFTATDSTGAAYQIEYFQTFLVFTAHGGRSRRLGRRLLKCNGQSVRWIGRGEYEMQINGLPVRLICTDPDAV